MIEKNIGTQMIKKYLNMTKAEYELIIKLVLCTVIATVFSWLMRDAHSPTTAVTANLFLWSDRGYRGSIRYAIRRVLAQIIQGVFVLLFIFPCRYYELAIPDVILITAACCFAIIVGLPINYKHTYAPFNCTLANATFVIACATVQHMDAFPKRVLQCVVGALIGYFVNYIVFSYKDRGNEILNLVEDCLIVLIRDRNFYAFDRNMASFEKEYAFIIDDKVKTKRKSKMSEEEINFLKWNKELLERLSAFVAVYEIHKNDISHECREIMWELFPYALMSHKQVIANRKQGAFRVEKIVIPPFNIQRHEDLLFLSRLIEYVNVINQYACPFS